MSKINIVPLEPFLTALQSDGFSITIRDYDRISTVLRAGGDWSIERLRDTLLVILARNEEQREAFLDNFDHFFSVDVETDPIAIDVAQALDDLRSLADDAVKKEELAAADPNNSQLTVIKPYRFPQLLIVIPVSILLFIGVLLWKAIVVVEPIISTPIAPSTVPTQPFELSPKEVNFGQIAPGGTITKTISIVNNTDSLLTLSAKLSSDRINDFNPISDSLNEPLEPGERRLVAIRFQPTDTVTGLRKAIYTISGSGIETQALLSGSVDTPALRFSSNTSIRQSEYKRHYDNIPYINLPTHTPRPKSLDWIIPLTIGIVLALSGLVYVIVIWRRGRKLDDEAALYSSKGPRSFSMWLVGGTRQPILGDEELTQLAEMLGYFQSELEGSRLNVAASINGTLAQGGVPALKYYSRSQLRTVIILENWLAEARVWNHAPYELAIGLAQRGVSVIHGIFEGLPHTFKTADGTEHAMRDFEDQSDAHIVLIFTEGISFTGEIYAEDYQDKVLQDKALIESLNQWPMLAWLDFREPRFWKESHQIAHDLNVQFSPATAKSILQVFNQFVTEKQPKSAYLYPTHNAIPNEPSNPEKEVYYIEQVLGEALPWAQDCAALQPMPLGLADKIRRNFHPTLGPEQIGRLFHLLGVNNITADGLTFSSNVERLLRRGLIDLQTDQHQEEVLRFILRHFEAAEPTEKDSMSHLIWEYKCERIRMELDPDTDLARLAQIAKTSLREYIETDFDGYGLPEQKDLIPLRIKPRSYAAQRRLAAIAKRVPTPSLQQNNRYFIYGIALAALIAFASCWWQYTTAGYIGPNLRINLRANSATYLRYDTLDINNILVPKYGALLQWSNELNSTAIQQASIDPLWYQTRLDNLGELSISKNVSNPNNTSYSATIDGENSNGQIYAYGDMLGISSPVQSSEDSVTDIEITSIGLDRPCTEQMPELNLTIERCILGSLEGTNIDRIGSEVVRVEWNSWRQQGNKEPRVGLPNRSVSIGLEIGSKEDPRYRELRSILLQTSSVDIIYHVKSSQRSDIERAIKKLRDDFSPIIGHIQIIWWSNETLENRFFVEQSLQDLGQFMQVSNPDNSEWITNLINLLKSSNAPHINEDAIRRAIGLPPTNQSSEGIVLYTTIQQPQLMPSPEDALYGHKSYVWSASYNRQGRRMVSSSFDATLRVWDVETGDLLSTIGFPYDRDVDRPGFTDAVFAPNGEQVISAGSDYTVRIWDPSNGKLLKTLEGHTEAVNSLKISSDGLWIVSASGDHTVRIWDTQSGDLTQTLEDPTDSVLNVSISSDDTLIAAGSSDGLIYIWNAQSGELLHTIENSIDSTLSISISPDNTLIASGSADGLVRIWNIQSGELLYTFQGHADRVSSVSINPDGKRVVSGSYDGIAKVWDLQTGKLISDFTGHTDRVLSVTFNPQSHLVATSSADGTIQEWDPESGKLRRVFGNRTILFTAKISPDNNTILSASGDGVLREWNIQNGSLLRSIDTGYSVRDAEYSRDGRYIVTASSNKLVSVWESQTGKWLFSLPGHEAWVLCASFSPQGDRIVSSSADGEIRVWSTQTRQMLLSLQNDQQFVFNVRFSPNGNRIVSTDNDGKVRIWDANTGNVIRILDHGDGLIIWDAEWSPDGKYVITASGKGAWIWNAQTGVVVTKLDPDLSSSLRASYNHDGTKIITTDTNIRIWNSSTGQLLETLKGHRDVVWDSQFNADDTLLVSSSADNTIRIWYVAQERQLIAIPVVHKNAQHVLSSQDSER